MTSTRVVPGCMLGSRKDGCKPEDCKTCGFDKTEAILRKAKIRTVGLRYNGLVHYLALPKRSKPT